MNSKTSFSNAGGGAALVRENLRRFWPLSLLGFLVYFLSGPLPVIRSIHDLDGIGYYLKTSLENQQAYFMGTHLLLPIIAAVLLLRYLNSPGSGAVMHALPFTRRSLLGSSVISGILLTFAPILANGMIYMAIARPIYNTTSEFDHAAQKWVDVSVNLFSTSAVSHWILESLIMVLFVLLVSFLAGIVTGNSIVHIVFAFAFNFLLPLCFLTFVGFYLPTYLFGYTIPPLAETICYALSPYSWTFQHGGEFSATACIVYLLVCGLLFAMSMALYQKRQLERFGDPIVFRFLEPVICFVIVFFAATGFNLYLGFYLMAQRDSLFNYVGYAVGILIGFLFAQMIVCKTIHIFNRASAKRLGIFTAILCLMVVCLQYDITGYEQRVPEPSQVTSVTMTQGFISEEAGGSQEITFKDRENILLSEAFHQRLIDDKESILNSSYTMSFSNLSFSYQFSNGKVFSRSYSVPRALLQTYVDVVPLFESTEFKGAMPEEYLSPDTFLLANIFCNNRINNSDEGESGTMLSHRPAIESLMAALSKDMKNRSFENMTSYSVPLCTIRLGYGVPQLGQRPPSSLEEYDIKTYEIYAYDSNTIAWLRTNGYEYYVQSLSELAPYLILYRDHEDAWSDNSEALGSGLIPTSTPSRLVVSDPGEIEQIAAACQTVYMNWQDYYQVEMVVYGDENQPADFSIMTYYLDPAKAPEKVIQYFNESEAL